MKFFVYSFSITERIRHKQINALFLQLHRRGSLLLTARGDAGESHSLDEVLFLSGSLDASLGLEGLSCSQDHSGSAIGIWLSSHVRPVGLISLNSFVPDFTLSLLVYGRPSVFIPCFEAGDLFRLCRTLYSSLTNCLSVQGK